ncbi:MAG: DUF3015 domain-containing protein [Actinobacteria bacterium]|jgi:DUF3015 family protein|nr:DUF3015 domain-containing protein [Actinomycetota bacterium]
MKRAISVAMSLSLFAVALLFSSCTTPDITDTLSTTTPGVWWGKDGTIKEEYKAIAFTTMNFDYVKQDLARGQGEHLASLATLMGVSESDQPRFFTVAQGRASELARSQDATPAAVLMALHASWSPAAGR